VSVFVIELPCIDGVDFFDPLDEGVQVEGSIRVSFSGDVDIGGRSKVTEVGAERLWSEVAGSGVRKEDVLCIEAEACDRGHSPNGVEGRV